ncbi:hypothetical protein [Diaphorobacter sp. JS3051]|uniref:hypothetical protein n=1 Tax=Diaphorobacter sp. JS3051 TaxID=2792224 RepID=UPI0018CBA741|nr:hypothetical protein [Diaphorobacter sp. JS3051]QPN33369.1 hypothetical protein I3K84_22015 [Diaphorobacter sp. JS3051]
MNAVQALKRIQAGQRQGECPMDAPMLDAAAQIATDAGALVDLIESAGDAQATLTNVLAHHAEAMTAADRRSRSELAQRLHSLLDALYGVQGCGGEG